MSTQPAMINQNPLGGKNTMSKKVSPIVLNEVPDITVMIRRAIELEMQEELSHNAQTIAQYRTKIVELEEVIAAIKSDIDVLKGTLGEKVTMLAQAKQAMKKFEGDEEMINQRVEMALAAMRGETVKKAKATKPRSAGASVKDVSWEITIDGKPRNFGTLTHLTYWLSKQGDKVGMDDLRSAFADQNSGIALLSSNHQGMLFVTVNGCQVGIAKK